MLDYIVYIGRFQPFHNGHKATIDDALKRAKKVIVLIGGDGAPRSVRDPFNYPERSKMILAEYNYGKTDTVFTAPLKDSTYNDDQWFSDVENAVENVIWSQGWTNMPPTVGLLVNSGEYSGYHGDNFPDWEVITTSDIPGTVHATDIRKHIFDGTEYSTQVPVETWKFLEDFINPPEAEEGSRSTFKELQTQYNYIKVYNSAYRSSPYTPIFQTVDALVVQDSHILLIKRRGIIGKDLWALPGGFVNAGETLYDACIRELVEETNISLRIEDCYRSRRVFDNPDRSCLAHIITTVHKFEISILALRPTTKAGDDAAEIKWWNILDITRDIMHDDHYYIIQEMTT